jgi:hypothetical protein
VVGCSGAKLCSTITDEYKGCRLQEEAKIHSKERDICSGQNCQSNLQWQPLSRILQQIHERGQSG